MADIDQRGSFYLGRRQDPTTGETADEPLLYDSSDLTTHAVCVGMTGSGKTGLCLALLEEAALDGIPAIAIDPKGDLGNLMLTFPELRPADFRPWIDESVAARDGLSPDAFAEKTAKQWSDGLAKWGEDGERVRRFKDAVDCSIYTPGSSAGLPLTVLKSFNAPPREVRDDADAFSDRVQAAASGVLALLGVDADPVNSREHILLSKVLETAWSAGRNLALADIIGEIQKPSFRMVGAVPLDSFLASKDRDALAMKLNNLLASPSFASWLEGEPLDVERLLYTTDAAGAKKPRLSIISIAHLNDEQRMFFVTLLLNEVISWMRSQPGTGSLRAILYMDEVFGFFPPSANPPAKKPMLTLLKQARAFGLGCVLATQNPVDLDYKGLSNAGTWLLGRLQTERDKMRVIEGLEGASSEAGAIFDRGAMERALSGLGKRVFLMNNVHDSKPVIFQSRWALSYLAGPLTRAQISRLMADRKHATPVTIPTSREGEAPAEPRTSQRAASEATPPSSPSHAPSAAQRFARPLLAGDVPQRFLPAIDAASAPITYRPAILGTGRIHYVSAADKVDLWRNVAALCPVKGDLGSTPWNDASVADAAPQLLADPAPGAAFADLPGALGENKTYATLKRELDDWLYQSQRFERLACEAVGETSRPDETEAAFRDRCTQLARTQCETEKAAVAEKFKVRIRRAEEQVARAEARVAEQKSRFWTRLLEMILRAFEVLAVTFSGGRSRKRLMTSSSASQTMQSRRQQGTAQEQLERAQADLDDLKHQQEDEQAAIDRQYQPSSLAFAKTELAPRKADVDVDEVVLAWLPWRTPASGAPTPAFDFPNLKSQASSLKPSP